MNGLSTVAEYASFGGIVGFYEHRSEVCDANMRFAVYTPPQAAEGPVLVLYYLSGLTSTEENFMVKGGTQRAAAERGLMLVSPDTSPRGVGLPGEGYYDPVTGVISPEAGFYAAGFYVDATTDPYVKHYKTYSYVTRESPAIVEANFSALEGVRGVFGHSIGGHGALVCTLRNPTFYRSVSAFAPLCAPSRIPWGREAFSTYLGGDEETWREYDASELVRWGPLPDGRTRMSALALPARLSAAHSESPGRPPAYRELSRHHPDDPDLLPRGDRVRPIGGSPGPLRAPQGGRETIIGAALELTG